MARKQSLNNKAVSLLELIIAIVLISVVTLSISSIETFSRFHLVTAERRAQVQNEVSLAMEYLSRDISRAIGNEVVFGTSSVVRYGAESAVMFRVDSNQNANLDNNDDWISYRVRPFSGVRCLAYCRRCRVTVPPPDSPGNVCGTCDSLGNWNDQRNIIARNIRQVTFTIPAQDGVDTLVTPFTGVGARNSPLVENNVQVAIIGCWNAFTAVLPDGTPDNPCVTMISNIKMPSVSAN